MAGTYNEIIANEYYPQPKIWLFFTARHALHSFKEFQTIWPAELLQSLTERERGGDKKGSIVLNMGQLAI